MIFKNRAPVYIKKCVLYSATNLSIYCNVSHQKHKDILSWGLSAITELKTPTKLQKKESARFDKISDLQGVLIGWGWMD
jgi:hypothetical protein